MKKMKKMKTKEELANKFADDNYYEVDSGSAAYCGFIAGYEASLQELSSKLDDLQKELEKQQVDNSELKEWASEVYQVLNIQTLIKEMIKGKDDKN